MQRHVSGGPRALLLCPTRELANQTTRVLRVLMQERAKLLRTAVVSKANMGSVEWNEMDIVLANPLRLNALLEVHATPRPRCPREISELLSIRFSCGGKACHSRFASETGVYIPSAFGHFVWCWCERHQTLCVSQSALLRVDRHLLP